MALWLCEQLKRFVGFVRGPRQPALGCLSNEELDRMFAQDGSGREDQN